MRWHVGGLVPVFGLVLARSVLGERLGETEIAGALLTLGCIGKTMRETVRRAPGGKMTP